MKNSNPKEKKLLFLILKASNLKHTQKIK